MNVDSTWLSIFLNLTFNIGDISGALLFSFLKVLNDELNAFMMEIVDGSFACHIMNTHARSPMCLHDVDSM
jgi:hypothetical protein